MTSTYQIVELFKLNHGMHFTSSHICKEGNSVADNFVNLELGLNAHNWWNTSSVSIHKKLFEDA